MEIIMKEITYYTKAPRLHVLALVEQPQRQMIFAEPIRQMCKNLI